MKKITLPNMKPHVLYFIENKEIAGGGSGRQMGTFTHMDNDTAYFSFIDDIVREDGSKGRSGLSTSGSPGYRHQKHFQFYKPMADTLMRRALVRRFINKTHQIDCDAGDYIG